MQIQTCYNQNTHHIRISKFHLNQTISVTSRDSGERCQQIRFRKKYLGNC